MSDDVLYFTCGSCIYQRQVIRGDVVYCKENKMGNAQKACKKYIEDSKHYRERTAEAENPEEQPEEKPEEDHVCNECANYCPCCGMCSEHGVERFGMDNACEDFEPETDTKR